MRRESSRPFLPLRQRFRSNKKKVLIHKAAEKIAGIVGISVYDFKVYILESFLDARKGRHSAIWNLACFCHVNKMDSELFEDVIPQQHRATFENLLKRIASGKFDRMKYTTHSLHSNDTVYLDGRPVQNVRRSIFEEKRSRHHVARRRTKKDYEAMTDLREKLLCKKLKEL